MASRKLKNSGPKKPKYKDTGTLALSLSQEGNVEQYRGVFSSPYIRSHFRDALALRSSESYDDPDDVNRISTIYAGLAGKAIYLPLRKGDLDGSCWLANEPLYIQWTPDVVAFSFGNSGTGMPVICQIPIVIPIVIPTPAQEAELATLARQCMTLKRASFAKESLSQELVAEVRAWAQRLAKEAPPYLRPSAQLTFATDPNDCLTLLERAVSWCAERLYGVEGQGPFDEF